MIGKRFDRIDRVGRITGKIPIGWVKKFGLVEVFHAGVSKKLLARSGAIVEWPNRKDRPRFKGKIEQSTMWWIGGLGPGQTTVAVLCSPALQRQSAIKITAAAGKPKISSKHPEAWARRV